LNASVIPATEAGLPAITPVIGEGISVNVTLIFSVERHRAVMDAYLAGLETAREAGHDLSKIHSIASLFVSRVDTEIDDGLETIGTNEALALRGQAGIASARRAYAGYEEVFVGGERYEALKVDGASAASAVGVDQGEELRLLRHDVRHRAGRPNTVNTMPARTLSAVADHGVITGDTVTGRAVEAHDVFDKLEALGVDLTDVFLVLEDEGVEKFAKSWRHLREATQGQLDAATK
jgi:transaldolase